MDCDFERVAVQVFRCRNCGKLSTPPIDLAPRRQCTATAQMPSIVRRAGNYIGSTARWIANGARYATNEQVADRIAICKACEAIDPNGTHCTKCGCPVSRKARRLVETDASDCPLNRWPVLTLVPTT